MTDARPKWYRHAHSKDMPLGAIARMIQTMLYAKRFFPYYVYNILGGIEEDGEISSCLLLSPFACPFGLPDSSCLPASALHSGTAWPHILSIAALSSSDPRMRGNSSRVAISCLRPPASSSHILLNSRRRYLCRAMAHMGICHCLSDRSSERDLSL